MSDLHEIELEVTQCKACPRLVKYREQVAGTRRKEFGQWNYWGKPVPGFGDPEARLLIVGLAPAAHGGNRTGRVFTGDRSGDFLFGCLYKTGFANQARSKCIGDGLELDGVYITAAVKCAPPDNKPTMEESISCSLHLSRELNVFPNLAAILCLGQFAFRSVLSLLHEKHGSPTSRAEFTHGIELSFGSNLPTIFGSYHPSPRNTQTGKLTEAMMVRLLRKVRNRIELH